MANDVDKFKSSLSSIVSSGRSVEDSPVDNFKNSLAQIVGSSSQYSPHEAEARRERLAEQQRQRELASQIDLSNVDAARVEMARTDSKLTGEGFTPEERVLLALPENELMLRYPELYERYKGQADAAYQQRDVSEAMRRTGTEVATDAVAGAAGTAVLGTAQLGALAVTGLGKGIETVSGGLIGESLTGAGVWSSEMIGKGAEGWEELTSSQALRAKREYNQIRSEAFADDAEARYQDKVDSGQSSFLARLSQFGEHALFAVENYNENRALAAQDTVESLASFAIARAAAFPTAALRNQFIKNYLKNNGIDVAKNQTARAALRKAAAEKVSDRGKGVSAYLRKVEKAEQSEWLFGLGAMMGSSAFEGTVAEVTAMDHKALYKGSAPYRELYNEFLGEGMDPEEAFLRARARVAGNAGLISAAISGAISAPTGLISKVGSKQFLEGGGFSGGLKEILSSTFLKEPLANAIQEGSGAFGSNVGVQAFADSTRELGSDVAQRAAEGAAVGGMMAGASGVGVPLKRGFTAGVASAAGATKTAGTAIKTRVKEGTKEARNPATDKGYVKASKDVAKQSSPLREELDAILTPENINVFVEHAENVSNLDLNQEPKAVETQVRENYENLMSATSAEALEGMEMTDRARKVTKGSKNLAEAQVRLEKAWSSTKDSQARYEILKATIDISNKVREAFLGYTVLNELGALGSLSETQKESLSKFAQGMESRLIEKNDVLKEMSTSPELAKLVEELEKGVSEDVQAYEGRVITTALLSPGSISREGLSKINLNKYGSVIKEAIEIQKNALEAIENSLGTKKGTDAAKVTKDILSRPIDETSGEGKDKKSLATYLGEISGHILKGDTDRATASLERLGMFALHMDNKRTALETSKLQNESDGKVPVDTYVPFKQLRPKSLKWEDSDAKDSGFKHKGMFYNPGKTGAEFYETLNTEANTVVDTYNSLVTVMKGTGLNKIEKGKPRLVTIDGKSALVPNQVTTSLTGTPSKATAPKAKPKAKAKAKPKAVPVKEKPVEKAPSVEPESSLPDHLAEIERSINNSSNKPKAIVEGINSLRESNATNEEIMSLIMAVGVPKDVKKINYMAAIATGLYSSVSEVEGTDLNHNTKHIALNFSKWFHANNPEVLKGLERVYEKHLNDLSSMSPAQSLKYINGYKTKPLGMASHLLHVADPAKYPGIFRMATVLSGTAGTLGEIKTGNKTFGGVLASEGVEGFLRTVSKSKELPSETVALAKQVLRAFEAAGTPFPTFTYKRPEGFNPSYTGSYTASKHEIFLAPWANLNTVLHEALHAVTSRNILEFEKEAKEGSSEFAQFVTDLGKFFGPHLKDVISRNAKNRLEAEATIKELTGKERNDFIEEGLVKAGKSVDRLLGRQYGLKNVHELLAEYVDPELALLLENTRVTQEDLAKAGLLERYQKYEKDVPKNLLQVAIDMVGAVLSWFKGEPSSPIDYSLSELRNMLFAHVAGAGSKAQTWEGFKGNIESPVTRAEVNVEEVYDRVKKKVGVSIAESKKLLSNGVKSRSTDVSQMVSYVSEKALAKLEKELENPLNSAEDIATIEDNLIASRALLAGESSPLEALRGLTNVLTPAELEALAGESGMFGRNPKPEEVRAFFEQFFEIADTVKKSLRDRILKEANEVYEERFNKQDKAGRFNRTPENLVTGANDRHLHVVELVSTGEMIDRGNGRPIEKYKLDIKDSILDGTVIAVTNWILNDSQRISEMWPEEMEQITGLPYRDIPVDVRTALNIGKSLEEAVTELSRKSMQYVGLIPLGSSPMGDITSLTGSLVVQALDAAQETGWAYFLTTTLREPVAEGEKEGRISKVFRGVTVSSKTLGVQKRLGSITSSADKLLLKKSDHEMFIGHEAIPMSSNHQLGNRDTLLNQEQKEALKNGNAVEHYFYEPMLDFIDSVFAKAEKEDKDGLVELGQYFGIDPVIEGVTLQKIKDSREGQLTSLRSAIDVIRTYKEELEKYSEDTGIPVNEIPVKFRNEITKVLRMQQVGRATPQSNTLMRHLLLPTRSEIALSNQEHLDVFMSAMAQSIFDQKVGRKKPNHWFNKMEDVLKLPEMQAILTQIQQHMKTGKPLDRELLHQSYDALEAATEGTDIGRMSIERTPLAVFSLMELVKVQEARSSGSEALETFAYIEQDGINNGILNALIGMASGIDSERPESTLRALRAGGVVLGNDIRTAADTYEELQTDLYGMGAESFVELATLTKETAKKSFLKENKREDLDLFETLWASLDLVLDSLMKGFALTEDGSRVASLDRDAVKYRFMERIYGSGLQSSAEADLSGMLENLFEKINKAKELAHANNIPIENAKHLLWTNELDHDPVLAKKTDDLLEALNNLTGAVVNSGAAGMSVYKFKSDPKIRERNKISWGKVKGRFPQTDITSDAFNMSSFSLKTMTSNVKNMYSGLVRESIDNVLGESVTDSMEALKNVTNDRSLLFAELFRFKLRDKLTEVRENDPSRTLNRFLSRDEINEILNSPEMKDLFPELDVNGRNFLVARIDEISRLPDDLTQAQSSAGNIPSGMAPKPNQYFRKKSPQGNVMYGSRANTLQGLDQNLKTYSPVGVGAMANVNIGNGDAYMIERLFQQLHKDILQVFDGINLPIARAFEMGTVINEAQAAAWHTNVMHKLAGMAEGNERLLEHIKPYYEEVVRESNENIFKAYDGDVSPEARAFFESESRIVPLYDTRGTVIRSLPSDPVVAKEVLEILADYFSGIDTARENAFRAVSDNFGHIYSTAAVLTEGPRKVMDALEVALIEEGVDMSPSLEGLSEDVIRSFGDEISISSLELSMSMRKEASISLSIRREAFLRTLEDIGYSTDQMSALNTPYVKEGKLSIDPENVAEEFNSIYQGHLDKLRDRDGDDNLFFSSLQNQILGKSSQHHVPTVLTPRHLMQTMKTLIEANELPPHLVDLYNRVLDHHIGNNTGVIIGNVSQARELIKKETGHEVDGLNSTGSYIVIPESGKTYIHIGPNASPETVLHELDHHVQFLGILNALNRQDTKLGRQISRQYDSLFEELVRELEDIQAAVPSFQIEEVLGLGVKEFIDALYSLEDSSGNNIMEKAPTERTELDRAMLYSELTSWSMANRDVAEFTKNLKQSKEQSERSENIIDTSRRVLHRFINRANNFYRRALAFLFNSQNRGDSFYEGLQTASSATMLVGKGGKTLKDLLTEPVVLNHSTSPSEAALANMRRRLNIKARDVIIDAPSAAAMQGVVNKAVNTFGLTPEQANTMKNMYHVLTQEGAIEPASLAQLGKLRQSVIRVMEPEHLLTENPTNREVSEATRLIDGLRTDELDQLAQTAMFMSLSATSPMFRRGLKNVAAVEHSSMGNYDGLLSNIATRAVAALDKMALNTNLENGLTLADTAIATGLADKNLGISDAIGAINDGVNKLDKKFVSAVREAFDGEKISQRAIEKRSKEDLSGRPRLATTLAFHLGNLLKSIQDGTIGDDALVNLARAERVTEEIPVVRSVVSNISSIVKEMVGRTPDNDRLYDLIKRVTFAIDTAKKNYKETVPDVIRKEFKNLDRRSEERLSEVIQDNALAGVIGSLGPSLALRSLTMRGSARNSYLIAKGQVSNAIGDPRVVQFVEDKVKQLVTFNRTGDTGVYLLQNARAIASGLGSQFDMRSVSDTILPYVEEMIAFETVDQMSDKDFDDFINIYNNDVEATEFLFRQIDITQADEASKRDTSMTMYNASYGYMPLESRESRDVVIAKNTEKAKYEELGYTQGEAIDDGLGYSYFYTKHNPQATFGKGLIQIIRKSKNGVDEDTGASLDLSRQSITDPTEVLALKRGFLRDPSKYKGLIPIHDGKGDIVGFDRVLSREMRDFLLKSVSSIDSLGTWQSRQIEERLSDEINSEVVKRVEGMWDAVTDDPKAQKAFIDISDPSKLSVTQRDALKLVPRNVMDQLKKEFDGPIMVRRDMFMDVFGRREASITDFLTGNTEWSPTVRNSVLTVVKGMFGDSTAKVLFTADAGIRGAVDYARHTIVIGSVIIPVINAISSLQQLRYSGVSVTLAAQEWPHKLKEAETYTQGVRREIELVTKMRTLPDGNERKRLQKELEALLHTREQLSIWPLIEAGEMNTIADLGSSGDNADLLNGRAGEWLDDASKKLTPQQRNLMRQGLVTKDTALYKGMEKLTLYGDFIAKSILYDKLVKKDGIDPKTAIKKVSEEFVNYDRLAGRTRNALENYGMLWFANFKLRSVRATALAFTRNPLTMLTMTQVPHMFGVTTSVQENYLSRFVNGNMGGMGPGLTKMSLTLNPYVQLAGLAIP